MSLPIIVCDLDGTLFDPTHRLHFIQQEPKNWKSFFAATPGDSVHPFCERLIKIFEDAGHEIVFVTGRPESSREMTIAQLLPLGFGRARLIMRSDKDRRDDHILKPHLIYKHLAGEDILFALEDRARVARALRASGITVLHVAEGDF